MNQTCRLWNMNCKLWNMNYKPWTTVKEYEPLTTMMNHYNRPNTGDIQCYPPIRLGAISNGLLKSAMCPVGYLVCLSGRSFDILVIRFKIRCIRFKLDESDLISIFIFIWIVLIFIWIVLNILFESFFLSIWFYWISINLIWNSMNQI